MKAVNLLRFLGVLQIITKLSRRAPSAGARGLTLATCCARPARRGAVFGGGTRPEVPIRIYFVRSPGRHLGTCPPAPSKAVFNSFGCQGCEVCGQATQRKCDIARGEESSEQLAQVLHPHPVFQLPSFSLHGPPLVRKGARKHARISNLRISRIVTQTPLVHCSRPPHPHLLFVTLPNLQPRSSTECSLL